jgi:hypothetical protein
MNTISSAAETFDNTVKGWLSFIDNNEYVSGALTVFLIVYASYAAPKLPPYILKLFDNPLFKLLIFFLIAYTAKKNPTVAIIAAVGLMVSIHALNKLKIDQAMMSLVAREKMESIPQESHHEMPHDFQQMEDIMRPEMEIHHEEIAELQEESKADSCGKKANFRNSFYPQYVHNKPDAYLSRYTGNEVNGFDANAQYASI